MKGTVSNVSIVFNSWNLNGGYPSDFYFELISPDGKAFDLLGGLNEGCVDTQTSTLTITFSDSGIQLPQDCNSDYSFTFTNNATYKPDVDQYGYGCLDFSGNHPASCPSDQGSGTFASVFTGATPNGTWTIYSSWEPEDAYDNGTISSLTLNLTTEVTQTATTTTVTPSASQAFTTSPNNTITYTATVTSGGNPVTEGQVQFSDNGVNIGSAIAVSSGSAQYDAIFISGTPEGVHNITASYTDTNTGPLYEASDNTANPAQVFVNNHTSITGATFCNNGNIGVVAGGGGVDSTTPYPQHVFVTGLTGGLASVNLQVNNITQTSGSFSDLDFLLVSPSGKAYVPIAAAGANSAVSGLSLTISDSGGAYLPAGTNPSAGTYLPTDYNSSLTFPNAGGSTLDSPPASGYFLPFNRGVAGMNTTFSSENLDATPLSQQQWSLYVASRNNGDGTTIGGYCLSFLTNGNTPSTTSLAANPNPASSGATITLTAHVTAGSNPVTTGTVTFYNGAIQLNTASLDGSGNATYSSVFTEGTYNLSAQYSGLQGQFNESAGSTSLEVDNPTTMTTTGTNSYSFCNAGPIDIAANTVPVQYPSRVFVTGIAGVISTLAVSVDGITYPTPDDLEMLLEGPGAPTDNIVFWGNIGSGASAFSDQNFTIEDGQTALPSVGSFSGGTYSAAAYSGPPSVAFPSPAPGSGSLNFAANSGSATFSGEFATQPANGTYQFFVYHNASGSTGTIGSHCVNITVTPPVLTLSKTHSGSFTQADTADTYTITVANSGPGSTAGTLTLTDTLPTGLTATAMSQTGSTGGGTGSDWSCTVGTTTCTRSTAMVSGESDTLTLTVSVGYNTATGVNAVTNSVSVSGGGISATQTANDPTTIVQGTSYTLTSGVSPSSSGTVTANPTNSTGFAAGHYIPGTTVTVTANPDAGYVFSSWSSSPDSVVNSNASSTAITMNANESVTANFAPVPSSINPTAGTPQSATVGAAFLNALQATVTNAGGIPVPNVLVTFTAPGSGASVTFPGGNTATTNAQGVASVSVTANTIPGSYTVQAAASGVATNASFSLTNNAGAVSSISITGGNNQAVTVGTAFSPLQILLKDSYGNPVPSTMVTFTAPGTGASGTFSNSTHTIALASAGNGTISASVTANTTAGGPYSVTLSATGVASPPSFSLTNNPGTASSISITGGNNQSIAVGTAFSSLQILLKDTYNNPVPGASVTFSAPATGASGTFSNSTNTIALTTGANGTISVPFTADTAAGGPYSVTLSTAGVTSPPSFSLTNNAGTASSISITGGNNQAVAGGSAFSPLQILLKDTYNNPVPGATVTFTAPATGVSGTFSNSTNTIALTTSANGTISVPFTANTTAGGPYSVALSVTGVASPPNFSLANNPGAASSITINAGTNQAVTIGTAFSPLQILLKDAHNNPVPGASVTFTAPATGVSGTFSNSTNTIALSTSANGTISVPFTANTTAGGPYSVTLSATGVTSPPSFSLANNPGTASSIAINAGNNQAVSIGTVFSALQVLVKDSNSNPVPNVLVTFTAPASGAGVIFSAGNTATTNAQGIASVSVTANSTAGSYTVQAGASGVAINASFSLANNPGAASSIAITAGNNQAVTIGTAFSPLQVLVKDSNGNLVPNVLVTFTAPASGAGVTFSAGNTGTTNAQGIASVSVTANSTAGSYTVQAGASGVATNAVFSLTNNPGAASSIAINAGNNQAVTIGTAFSPLQILLKDSSGNPVPNVLITFTAPASGASATFPGGTTATTNVQGLASVPVTANTTAGSYTVQAGASGLATNASFSLTNIGIPQIGVSPGSWNFGDQALNTTSAAQIITLSNAGSSTLAIGSVAINGTNPTDFSQTNNCAAVAPAASCTISVTYTPSAAGSRTANLSIADNAAGSPQTISLSGNGVVPENPTISIDRPSSLSGPFNGLASFLGWAVNKYSSIVAVNAAVDGVPRGTATYGATRTDVCQASPGGVGCPDIGWTLTLDTGLFSNGSHTLSMTALTADGRKSTASASFTVANWSSSGNAMTISIDKPAGNAPSLSGATQIAGWAIDTNAPIATVQISIDGVPYGTAAYGGTRPDVCAVLSGRPGCPNVGWNFILNTKLLTDGTHTLAVTGTTADGQTSTSTSTFSVANLSGGSSTRVSIDRPNSQTGPLSGLALIAGWALDDNAAITEVDVSVDGVVLSTASYGGIRTDVCTVYPGRPGCPKVGWNYLLDTTQLTDGAHKLQITAKTNTGGLATVGASFTVSNAASATRVLIDAPSGKSGAYEGLVSFAGWALDDSSAIAKVVITIDGAPSGTASYGLTRSDVCAVYPGRPGCPAVGWSFLFDTGQLPNGPHLLGVVATTADGRSAAASASFTVANWASVNPNAMRLNIDAPSPQSGALTGMAHIAGWALDDDAAITSVQIAVDNVAYGAAAYGGTRSDVCTAYPKRAGCPNVGWNFFLDTTLLADGAHTLAITGISAGGQSATITASFTVGNLASTGMRIDIDKPNSTSGALSGISAIGGWAIDDTAGLANIEILVDGISVGTANYGGRRADVCGVFPGRTGCPNVGWNFLLDTTELSNGSHALQVTGTTTTGQRSTVGATFTVSN